MTASKSWITVCLGGLFLVAACTVADGPVNCAAGTGNSACAFVATESAWPGTDDVTTADGLDVLGRNMSGLVADPAPSGDLWSVRNSPGTLFRLTPSSTGWVPDAAGGWASGRALRYPDNSGDPDAEGVTITAAGLSGGLYVVAERDNLALGVSRNSILRYDVSQSGGTLRATHEWNLTALLPSAGANLGLEAVSWLPDSMLTANGLLDERTGMAYRPADYPSHGTGLFFVGAESGGGVHAFALNHATSSASQVASFASGLPAVMGMEYDDLAGQLWATCDNGCGNRSAVLEIALTGADRGRMRMVRKFLRPSSLPDVNNEGFAIAPRGACVGGRRAVVWADDDNTAGHALRRASLPCTPVAAR